MDDYRKHHAGAKPRTAPAEPKFVMSGLHKMILFIILTPILLYAGYKIGRSLFTPAEPWTFLPTDPEAAVTKYIKLVGNDGDANNASHKAAYALIASNNKNPNSETEPDRFLQYHHEVYTYFAELTGDKFWHDHATISLDPKRPDAYEIKIGPEIVHIAVVDEAPEKARNAGKHHFAVTPILEIDPNSEARRKAGQREASFGIVRGVAGEAGVESIKAIAALGAPPRESPMDKKMRLLPRLTNPRAPDLDRDIISLWPIRTDPAVIYRLGQLITDDRYSETTRDRARKVLNGTLDEETRAAVGVD
jgi:hypothetical protein